MTPLSPEEIKQRLLDQEKRWALIIIVLTVISLFIFSLLIALTLNLIPQLAL